MEGPPPPKIKPKKNCPFGDDFYSNIARLLLSEDPDSLKELKKLTEIVQKAKLKPGDELWDSGDDFAPEAETAFRSTGRQKKVKVEKDKDKEKKVEEKSSQEKSEKLEKSSSESTEAMEASEEKASTT